MRTSACRILKDSDLLRIMLWCFLNTLLWAAPWRSWEWSAVWSRTEMQYEMMSNLICVHTLPDSLLNGCQDACTKIMENCLNSMDFDVHLKLLWKCYLRIYQVQSLACTFRSREITSPSYFWIFSQRAGASQRDSRGPQKPHLCLCGCICNCCVEWCCVSQDAAAAFGWPPWVSPAVITVSKGFTIQFIYIWFKFHWSLWGMNCMPWEHTYGGQYVCWRGFEDILCVFASCALPRPSHVKLLLGVQCQKGEQDCLGNCWTRIFKERGSGALTLDCSNGWHVWQRA